MRIVFVSAHSNSPSYIFYAANLSKINVNRNDASVDIKDDPSKVDYPSYDVALFTSFDEASSLAKASNPLILTGVVDPRSGHNNTFADVDVIVVNGIEQQDYFSRFDRNMIVYYAFPEVPARLDCPVGKNTLVLGYHGNSVHLNAMFPRVTKAIARLARERPVELWAMHDVDNSVKRLGNRSIWDGEDVGFPSRYIQYSLENYARYIAHVDIGLVPQFIPVKESHLLRNCLGSRKKSYNERFDNFFFRFKETTNIGRHLVFAQYAIPVVSDMSPSACALIDDDQDGYLAFHTESWVRALKKLATNGSLRTRMGERLKAKYLKSYTPETMNEKLLSFFRETLAQCAGKNTR